MRPYDAEIPVKIHQAVQEVLDCPELRQRRLMYLCLAGSYAYGRNRPDSDVDLRGIFLPSVSSLLLQKKEYALQPGEADCLLQPLARFFELASMGNPNVLEWLFVRPDHIFVCTAAGRLLLENRSLFLSQRMFKSYLGFAAGSWRDLQKMLQQYRAAPSPDMVFKMIKHASHIERLLVQLVQVLESGTFSTWNPKRTMPLKTKQDQNGNRVLVLRSAWLQRLKSLHEQVEQAMASTALPKTVDRAALECLQLQILTEYVKEVLMEQEQSVSENETSQQIP